MKKRLLIIARSFRKNITIFTANSGSLRRGFTLPEVALSIGIISIIFGFIVMNLNRLTRTTSVITARDVLLSDIKSQQEKAMSGTDISGTGESFGIYFSQEGYILFSGTTFSPSETSNIVKTLPENIILSEVTFPSSIIVFASRSGEIINYSGTQDTFRITNMAGSESSTVEFNRLGVVSDIN